MDIYKQFGRINAGYGSGKPKPTQGDLLLDGQTVKTNLPFALLQFLKKQFVDKYGKNRVKISYAK